MTNPLIVALDVPSAEMAVELVEKLQGLGAGFKIGSELFTAAGPDLVKTIRRTGARVFLDLKFHDIPNTVAKAVAAAVRLDVQMLTIHASGGFEMMQAAENSAQETAARTAKDVSLILGVTVLTSLDANGLTEIGVAPNMGEQVERLAMLAVRAGLRGLVCSALEAALLRQIVPSTMQLVTPGIRPANSNGDDQKRTLSAAEAIAAGANWLVVGRPIYGAPNPREAAQKLLESIHS